ncbi:unnamed protein product [Dicrocoelium dendriticum]|nr:unnamed protein product [Dicrocoelium dendriticum]
MNSAFLGPLHETDRMKRSRLERIIIGASITVTIFAIAFLIAGIGLLAAFGDRLKYNSGLAIFGMVLFTFAIPLSIASGCLINAVFVANAGADEARNPRVFRPEELLDVDYPRQPTFVGTDRLNQSGPTGYATPPPGYDELGPSQRLPIVIRRFERCGQSVY